jgi:thioredoxin reductase (NADPH)
MTTHNLIIVGGGPAGYTAALYAARADLKPVVVEGYAWGGLLQQTTEVENFPGFPAGIMGPDLMTNMRAQAERFGAVFVSEDAVGVELSTDGGTHRVQLFEETLETCALILATGADHVRLGIPGEEEFSGRGVSYCATCDAAFFRDKDITVIGGGDSAMEEALFLAKFGSRVTIVHRRDEFRASRIMLERAQAEPKIEFLTPFEATELRGNGGAPFEALGTIALRNSETGETIERATDACFIAIGHHPVSEIFAGQVKTDAEGYVLVTPGSSRTATPGVFACGDLVDRIYRQAITAAGSGCQAALDAEWYLRDHNAPASAEASV